MPEKPECRIVITFRRDGNVEVAMCDPKSGRVEKPIVCDGSLTKVDNVVNSLKQTIEQSGNKLTICERSE